MRDGAQFLIHGGGCNRMHRTACGEARRNISTRSRKRGSLFVRIFAGSAATVPNPSNSRLATTASRPTGANLTSCTAALQGPDSMTSIAATAGTAARRQAAGRADAINSQHGGPRNKRHRNRPPSEFATRQCPKPGPMSIRTVLHIRILRHSSAGCGGGRT